MLGGRSKCHICESISCDSDLQVSSNSNDGDKGSCNLQLQGVSDSDMSINIPTVSDTAWAVGGSHRHDYGGDNVTHFCVLLSHDNCILPSNTDFSTCAVRCFGYGFQHPAKKLIASNRSVIDVYAGMNRWRDDGAVDLWTYPSNCDDLYKYQDQTCTYSGSRSEIPSFNPQGFTFSYSGSGLKGFVDGPHNVARFNAPEDVAVDEDGVIYVADTQNHAIRMVKLDGSVITIAGKGPDKAGIVDGDCADATFSSPKGLDVRLEMINNVKTVVIIIADTGNHRIRRILYNPSTSNCTVACHTGLCGNNYISETDYQFKATPISGFADGSGLVARFSAPESVGFLEGNHYVVADTGNYLIRIVVASTGDTSTLAGHVVEGPKDPDGKPAAGCTAPCMQGKAGFRDGPLDYAEFYNPLDVTRGPNNTVWVADEQRLRLIELPDDITEYYTIKSRGRVSTIAGDSLQGHDDGLAQESNFFYSTGVFVTPDNIAYILDSVTCRVRRVTPFPLVAETISCSTKAVELVRPSGCTSFDQPIDKIGRKVSRVERNIQYNFGEPYGDVLDKGKYIKNCVGVPPVDVFDKHFIDISGDNLVIDDHRVRLNEDSEEGMAILVYCPHVCSTSDHSSYILQGTTWYSDQSNVCIAAVHDGKLNTTGGYVQLVMQRLNYLDNLPSAKKGSTQHGITSTSISTNIGRVFSLTHFNISNSMVHTVAGAPSAPLEFGCGFKNGQPSTTSLFSSPSGIAARYNDSLTDGTYLYIADTKNNRIRAISASCTQICENGGRCIGPDFCSCAQGWTGVDCTKPVCSSSCGLNSLCVAPNTCGCKPGYKGQYCDIATCVQTCHNDGICSSPDTCSCTTGWFDSNCTTPVCAQTCANGGNCIGPNTCKCPTEWGGNDCRTPQCHQICKNDGYCVAPNTCVCSPRWSGFDCSIPVCSQGFFQANIHLLKKPTYKNCDLQSWCNATNEFECDQLEMKYVTIRVPSGPAYVGITGKKTPPNECMNIELPTSFKVPFQLVYADGTTTGNLRYSPITPYESYYKNEWRGYTYNRTDGHTGPWTYEADRQVANVNWFNMSQGTYVCANGGKCINPDICACAPGWIGFDCRTPVCNQGYYQSQQATYLGGLGNKGEVEIFAKFLNKTKNSYTLQGEYSNPDYNVDNEYYFNGPSIVKRETIKVKGARYNGSDENLQPILQGGYRCSIRANTQWENENFVFSHPNFYSRYMNIKRQEDGKIYTFWVKNMSWPPTHRKSRVLDKVYHFKSPKDAVVTYENLSFSFTNEGYRRYGIWNRTSNPWAYGACIMEFFRDCVSDRKKQYDVFGKAYDSNVQDTDLAFRPRITYDDRRVHSIGRWKQAGGSCVDNVIRGCANNGTCIAPNTCKCAKGWSGFDCKTPLCIVNPCLHNGNCTLPETCTCEKGWTGIQCEIPMCAQECQNGGQCVAPDVCKCYQWPNEFRDGRSAGGRPLFQDYDGTPLMSGWMGYDCASPICTQNEKFILNVPSNIQQLKNQIKGFELLGGHGGDALMTCTDPKSGITLPRCPQYDIYVTGNDGQSFQTGCGFDPFDTGCCFETQKVNSVKEYSCFQCDRTKGQDVTHFDDHEFYCSSNPKLLTGSVSDTGKLEAFLDPNRNFRICGSYHSPRVYTDIFDQKTYGTSASYFNVLEPYKSNFNRRSNVTSNRFLCHVYNWTQGDYIDDAGLGSTKGVGSVYGLDIGRSIRINTPNIIYQISDDTFRRGDKIRGEGVYACYNGGSCIGPDICTCTDGYEGYNCDTPLCRHLQVTTDVSGCLNGGICSKKDNCVCIQTISVLWLVHPSTSRGFTGWTGTDCSMPICIQGYYDPFCNDLPQAPGAEGCFRCSNGGNCTAPDVCTCAPGWSGFDCKTPVCEVIADPLTRTQLGTVFEDKVTAFEKDPCGVVAIYGMNGWRGTKYKRGNCTQPNQCTCLCKIPYNQKICRKTGNLCNGPWQDDLVYVRDLLMKRGAEYTFGSTDCYYGFEGNVDELDRFTTCHQTIYAPTSTERDSLLFIILFSCLGFIAIVSYRYVSARVKRRFLLAKIERRRSRRDSEASANSINSGNNSIRNSSVNKSSI